MAIAVMRKLRVAAISYEENKILDALQKTGAAEIRLLDEEEHTHRPASDAAAISARLEEAEEALSELSSFCERYAKEHKQEFETVKDGFFVSYDEFIHADEKEEEAVSLIKGVKELYEKRTSLNAELTAHKKKMDAAYPYRNLEIPFAEFAMSFDVKYYLGIAKELDPARFPLAAVTEAEEGEPVLIAAHRSVSAETEELLRECGFEGCPFLKEEGNGAALYARLCEEEAELLKEIASREEEEFALADRLRFLKVYCDRVRYELEKARETGEKMLSTEHVLILEAYVPKGSEEEIGEALRGASDCAYYDFTDTPEDETPPTLMKNGEVVKNFEAITNLYSPPNAREFDPSLVMAFFYSLFLGFIMGDIGYGLFMVIGGGILWWKNRVKDNGLKRLSAVFCIGGIASILWGILFNSLFGIAILPVRVMPGLLAEEGAADINWHILGIGIPALLIIALELGVLQLFAGYVCRAIQSWRRGHILDGILDGVTWALFSVGVGVAIAGLVEEAHATYLAYGGGIAAGAMLVVAMLTAGRKEKFVGKFTKGFGAAYGVINYVSDILSYARLYGLMLSGAVIAEIVSDFALVGRDGGVGMIMSGNVGLVILGIVLLVVGHVLNLALSLLGAYIHDARLQYVEFYGRFYEGEGELFVPLGSKHAHVFIVPKEVLEKGKS